MRLSVSPTDERHYTALLLASDSCDATYDEVLAMTATSATQGALVDIDVTANERVSDSDEGDAATQLNNQGRLVREVLKPSSESWALRRFEGLMLATYSWGSNENSRTLELRLGTVSYEARENAMPKLGFVIKTPGSDSLTTLEVALTVTRPKGSRDLRIRAGITSAGTRDLVLAREDDIVTVRTEADLAPRKIPDSADFGATYFWVQGEGQTSGLKIERKLNDRIAPFWTRYNPDLWQWRQPLPADPQNKEEWVASILAFVCWVVLSHLRANGELGKQATPGESGDRDPAPGEGDGAEPRRLSANALRAELEERDDNRIRLPWHVLEAACTSLNSGKHLILTGPPGCGKTELAQTLAWMLSNDSKDGLVTTASPSWTTGDLVGRYFPAADGRSLEFRPGFFLQALKESRCLVIDELNRARIDECFGELFTTLSGHNVDLPFRETSPEDPNELLRVRVVARDDDDSMGPTAATYRVPPDFRIIGTMNDADRSELSPLSFALLRRFDVIRIEAPAPDVVRDLIQKELSRKTVQERLAKSGYQFEATDGVRTTSLDLATLEKATYLSTLFASGDRKPDPGDLVTMRIIGIATVLDVVRFVMEGITSGSGKTEKCEVDVNATPDAVVASYAAMAVVLKVLPQLDSQEWETQNRAIKLIATTFHETKHPLVRLNPGSTGTALKAEIVTRGGRNIRLVDYFLDEVELHYRRDLRDGRFSELRMAFAADSGNSQAT